MQRNNFHGADYRALSFWPFFKDVIKKVSVKFNKERLSGVRREEEIPCLCEESLLNEND